MVLQHLGLRQIQGSLVTVGNIAGHMPMFEEVVTITLNGHTQLTGKVMQVDMDKAVILVFEGTKGIALNNTATTFTGKLMETALDKSMLGRTFNGIGEPIDGMGSIFANITRNVYTEGMNPVHRVYPRNYIHTGFSAIDGLITLIRGQKLPIFSGEGLPHNNLVADIATRAKIAKGRGEKFAVVFAAIGVTYDTATFFRQMLEESGAIDRTIMYINLTSDPVATRIATPRYALTAAEYLAYDLGYHVLAILTDMTAYAEAVREISSSNGEIPSRKGYPGYMYSDLASIYERAGIIKGSQGSLTQIPIITMPSDDITHPIPDLTGYITEGQIVLDRGLDQQGIYPPIHVLPSLSRLMKDGIGEGYTTPDHQEVSMKLFAKYAKVKDVRGIAAIIGEEDLTPEDREILAFGEKFEQEFLHQDAYDSRTIEDTMARARELIGDFS